MTKVVSLNLSNNEMYTLCDKICQWLTIGQWFLLPIKLTITI